MKLLHVFWNYVRFVRTQGVTSWLTLLSPIILIVIVGIGLNLETSNKLHVAVYGDDAVLDILSGEESLEVLQASSPEDLQTLVRSKQAVMGIVVTTASDGKHIDIYIDSTKQAVASSMLLMVDKAVNEEKSRSGASLTAIQARLAPTYAQLKEKRGGIAAFSAELNALRQNISATRTELQTGRNELASYRAELLAYRQNLSSLDEYNARLGSYNSRLGQLYSEIGYRSYERDNALNKLSYQMSKVNNYIAKVDTSLSYLYYAKSYVPTSSPGYGYLVNLEGELVTLRSDLVTANNDMAGLSNDLAAIDFLSMQTEVHSVQDEIATTQQDLSEFRDTADSRIASMLEDINATDAKLQFAISKLDEFDSKVYSLQSEVAELDSLMGSALGPLGDFLGKKPEDLLPPTVVSKGVFPSQKWIDMFFPSLIGIDMLLASLLLPMIMKVRMREQGVELRMMRSRVSSISVVLGEMAANYAICMLQLFLIIFLGLVFFGVQVTNPFGLILVFLTLPMVFTSLGVLLSQIVNRSSTAFLLSLLVGIPMIFISGTIIPMEFLNPIIAMLGTIMPLYIVIDFGEKMLFRNLPVFDALLDSVYILFFIGLNTMASIVIYALKR